ncbi:MAG TPA: Glu-tRNA(Gln) amidotransferase subunit GatD [Candidatus Thalassarchaeaceae archaeon]|nr:MAG TPA: Glu-tRNA(Gln) amidotransferase GatDE subunit D [Candidatus Poseidoniales archaeon]HII48441.1 Glu-tRNA(Gln) amidotransferase subunit GatD [Candidatus Thalassarchaeaceae archaeon]|tara:strand:- start:537 stop:1874 length:1338 start_codon:yes stop_codon:yes gene_type:complete
MDNLEAGSYVRLRIVTRLGEQNHEGILLAPADSGLVTIKLENGYNLSHPTSAIKEMTLLDSELASDSKALVSKQPMDGDLPLVTLIHTGGTIASKVDYATGAVIARFEPEELIDSVPELREIARIETTLLGNMFSDDIRPRHWNQMITETQAAFDRGSRGVVITHGTDTMGTSAAAMSFAWSGDGGIPPGPIVFTGSQRSSDRGSSDARENLIAAVHLAAHGPTPNSGADAAVVVMHAGSSDGIMAIHAGHSVRKTHSSRRDAFESIDRQPLGSIELTSEGPIVTMIQNGESRTTLPPLTYNENTKIAELIAGAHMQPEHLQAIIATKPDAIHLHGTGLGHLPTSDPNGDSPENIEIYSTIRDYVAGGGIAVATTQTIRGPVHMDVYSKGRDLREIGVLGHGMNGPPETSLVKLHYLLSRDNSDRERFLQAWASNLIGERDELKN